MKNYILALMLIPLLLHGQKFRDSEVKFIKDGGGKLGTKTAVVESVPRLLSYQGFLTDGGGPINDGQRTVTFRLFDKEEGGLEFWTETHLVTITDGLISALLGSKGSPINSVPMNSYLEIVIQGNVLSPRQQITSVLYSVLSDSTNFAKGYTKTIDLSEVAHSGEYVDLLNAPDLTPFATKDTLSNFATIDTLFNNFTLSSQISVVALSNNYYDLDSLPNLEDYAVTDTLSYYVTEVFFDSTIVNYVSHDSLDSLIDTKIQSYDSDLEDIAMLDDDGALATGHLIIYDEDSSKWVSEGGAAARSTLGLGEMSIQEPESVNITGGRIVGIELDSLSEDLGIANGGTGASSADSARFKLGLKIGTSDEDGDVQAYSDALQNFADASETGVAGYDLLIYKTTDEDGGSWELLTNEEEEEYHITASRVEYGDFFISNAGETGEIWMSKGEDEGVWVETGPYINSSYNEEEAEGTFELNVYPEDGDPEDGGKVIVANDDNMLPVVDGSQLHGINATQINSTVTIGPGEDGEDISVTEPGPVSNDQFELLSNLRLDPLEDHTHGDVQGQLDLKQNKYPALDEIGQLEPQDFDVLMWMSNVEDEIDGGDWSLVTEDQHGIKADRVEYGDKFIDKAGVAGQMWVSRGMTGDESGGPRGHWVEGGDISRVYTEQNQDGTPSGLIIGNVSPFLEVTEEDVLIRIDVGTDVHQIPQLTAHDGDGGSLPEVDGSKLYGLDANQIGSTKTGEEEPRTSGPVSNDQFELLSNLRLDPLEDYTHGDVQGQLDHKIDKLDPEDSDVLMWMSDPGEWSLVEVNDGYTDNGIPKDRINNGQFFISSAGGTGEIWMSKGSEKGVWAETGPHINTSTTEDPDEGTLELNVYPGGKVIVVNDDNELPAVNGSQLHGINATQINSTVEDPGLVSNDQFDLLSNLRLDPLEDHTHGDVQGQLDEKQKKYPALDEIGKLEPASEDVLVWLGDDGVGEWSLVTEDSEEKIRDNRVESGEFFIKTASPEAERVWTWFGDEDGYGYWKMPPGAQRLNDLDDASTMPLVNDTESSNNVFIGEGSGASITQGDNNTALGRNTLNLLQDGNINVAIGAGAGQAIVGGSGNILIGYNAGDELMNESNKLIIDNNGVIDGIPISDDPLIEGDFKTGEVMINGSLYATNSLHLGSIDDDDPKFTIETDDVGNISIKSERDEKRISFAVNGDDELLTMDGDGVIKLMGETKIASDDDPENTYINFDEGGSNLNLYGAEDVVVNAVNEFTLDGENISINGRSVITIKNEAGEGNKIRFMVEDAELLTMESEEEIKLIGTTKIASDGTNDTYINMTDAGANLNLYGKEDVVINAGGDEGNLTLDSENNVVVDAENDLTLNGNNIYLNLSETTDISMTEDDIIAIESDNEINLTSDNEINLTSEYISIDAENEFVVENDMRVGRKFTVGDGPEEDGVGGEYDFNIRHDSGEAGDGHVHLKNTKSDKNIIFEVADGAAMSVIDSDGDGGNVLIHEKLEIGDENTFIHSSTSGQLDLSSTAEDGVVKINSNTKVDGSLTIGTLEGGNTLVIDENDGQIELLNTKRDKNIEFQLSKADGPLAGMRLNGDDDHVKLEVTNKVIIGTGTSSAGSELQFAEYTEGTNIGTISGSYTDGEAVKDVSEIVIDRVNNDGGLVEGTMTFKTRTNGVDLLSDLLYINAPDYVRNDDGTYSPLATYDKNITVPADARLNVLGKLYTDEQIFAVAILPDEDGATIGNGDRPWRDLYLYDGNVIDNPDYSSAIYFTNPADGGAHDVEILHDPTKGIRVKGDKQLQFNSANSYIKGSGENQDEILHLVSPTLYIQGLDETGDLLALDLSDDVIATEVEVDGIIRATQMQAEKKIFVGASIGNNDYEFTIETDVDDLNIRSNVAGQDIVFKGYAGDANVEVMRMDDQSLNMNEGNKVKFRSQDDDISYIHSSEANQLDIVSATIELSAPEDNVTVNVDGALKAKTELGLNNVDDSDDFVIKREEENPDYVFINKNESGDLIFKTNTGGGDDEKEVMRVLGNTGDVLIEDADAEESNKLQFYDDDQYIYVTIEDDGDFPDKTLNIVAEGSNDDGLIKIGKAGSTEKVEVEADNFRIDAIDVSVYSETDITMVPEASDEGNVGEVVVLSKDERQGEEDSPATLVLKRNDLDADAVVGEDIGEIVGRGKNDGGALVDFSSILFSSPALDAADPRGAIYFKTKGTTFIPEEGQEDKLMDINGSTANTVTIKGDLDVGGSITMNGASFTDAITSDEAGQHSLGTQATVETRGEWSALHLWDYNDDANAKITFGGGTDDVLPNNDVVIEHDPTILAGNRGLQINEGNRFQFRNIDTYIHSSDVNILDLVAPTLNIDAETNVAVDADGVLGIALTAATGDVTLTTTDPAKKVILNTGTAGILSHTSDADDEDFTIEQVGDVDASLIITSAGTGADAIALTASAGGITAKVADEQTLQLSNNDADAYIKLNASADIASETIEIKNTTGTAAGAIALTATAGGIDIDGGTGVTIDGSNLAVNVTGASGIALTAATGDVTLTTTDPAKKVILNTGTAGILSHTSDADDEDFTIEQVGDVDASLIITSAGTGADAIALTASAGGITAKVADEQTLQLSNNDADAYIKLNASADIASETIEIKNTTGTAAGAIALTADGGGISVTSATEMNITAGTSMNIDGGTLVDWTTDNAIDDGGLTIRKTNVTETLTSAGPSLPKFVLDNTAVSASGSIVMKKSANEADEGILGSIKGEGSSNNYVKIDLMSKDIEDAAGHDGAVVFNVIENGASVQMLGINNQAPNTVSIGHEDDESPTNLQVFGSLIATSTAYNDDLKPGTRGAVDIGTNGEGDEGYYEWGNLYLDEGGIISIGGGGAAGEEDDVELEQKDYNAPGGTDRGLLLNSDNKLFFETENQFIGSATEGDGITTMKGLTEVLIEATQPSGDGGGIITINASNGMSINTNVAGKISHTSDEDAEDFTIEQAGNVDASLIIKSAGTGADAIELKAEAGGIMARVADEKNLVFGNTEDVSSDTYVKIAASADANNEKIEVKNTSGVADDAIALTASAGGITAKVANEKNLVLGNASTDTYFKLAASADAASQIIEIKNATGNKAADLAGGGAIRLDALVGGVALNAGTDLKIDAANALQINSSSGAINIGNGDFTGNIDIGNSASARTIIVGEAAVPSTTTEIELNAALVDLNAGANGFSLEATGPVSGGNGNSAVSISVPSAPAATNGYDISLTAGAGTGGGDKNGGSIILTTGLKANNGNNGLVAVKSGASAPAELYMQPNDAAADAQWKFIADADGDSLTMSSVTSGTATARLVIRRDGKIFSPGGFAGDMASDELTTDNQMELSSNQQAADAVRVWGKRGGVLVDAHGDYAEAIKLHATAGPLQTIVVENTAGTDNAAIALTSTAGGITAKVADEKTLQLSNTEGDTYIKLNPSVADAANETVQIVNAVGTDDAAIALTSTAGGITAKVADEKTLQLSNTEGDTYIKLNPSVADAANETVQIVNAVGTDDAAIALTSTAGGITAMVANEKNLTMGDADEDSYFKVSPSATPANETVQVVNTDGTDNAAIALTAVAGGITAKVADEKNLVLGNVNSDTYFKVAASNTPATEIVEIKNTSGDDNASIALTAVAGGITAKVADEKNLVLGNVNSDTYFKVAASNTPATEIVEIKNTSGDDNASIALTAVAGGITAKVADEKTLQLSNTEGDTYIKLNPSVADAANETVQIVNAVGTASGSIEFTSSAGGVDINAATVFTVAGTNFSVSEAGLVSSTLGFAGPMTSSQMTSSDTILISSSNDAPNSVQITSTVGGIDISASGAGPTEDIDIVATGSSVNISSSEGGGALDAITINATAGGIDINSALAFDVASSASVAFSSGTTTTIDATGVLDIDGANTTIDAAGTLTIKGTGASKYGDDVATLNFDGSGAVTQTDMTNVTIDPSGTLTMQGAGVSKYGDDIATLNFDGTGVVTETDMTSMVIAPSGVLEMQGGGISKYGDDVAWWKFDGDGAVIEENMTSIAITPSAALTLTAGAASTLSTTASALTLTGGAASNWSTSDGILTVSGDDGLVLTAANSDGIKMNSINGEFLVTATGQDIDLRSLSLTGDFTGALSLDAVGTSDLTNDGALTVAATGASGALTLTGAAASTWSTSAGALTLDGAAGVNIVGNAGEVDITTAGIVEMNSSSIDIKNIAGSTAGLLRLYEDPSDGPEGVPDFIAFKAGNVNNGTNASAGGGFTFTWPNDYGTDGQVLKTNGSGVMTWVADQATEGSVTNSNVFGTPLDGTDVSMSFDGETHDGLFKWMENDDKFEFHDHILMTPVNSTQLQFGDPQVYIWSSANAQLDLVSDGAIVVGAATNINLTATDDVILPANVGILFGSGEKIEGDNTDLTVTSGADIVLSATTNVNIPQNKGLSFATDDAEKISSDGTDLTVNSGGDIILSATTNVNIPQNKGLSFATDDAEKISSDGTDLTVNSGGDINLTAASGDINIPNDIGVMYGIGGEKIESDGTDLTITSTGSLILTASGVSGSAIKDEDNMSSDSDTHLASQQSIKAYVDAQGSATETLTNKTLTSPKLNENVAVTTTATELNLIDGATARGTDAIADGDGVLINDGGTMKMTTVETLAAYLDDEITAMPALVTTAATTVGTISSGTWEGTDVAVAHGGTGVSTLADGGLVIGNAASAVEVVAAGLTTEILVGGGASTAPVWTTVTGTGAPVRAVSPTLTTPILGTPTSGVATNLTGLPLSTGVTGTLKHENGGIEADISAIATGGLLVGTASGTMGILAVGSDNHVLTVQSNGSLGWEANSPRPEAPPSPTSSSDSRFKKNISTVSGALEKLSKLNPVNYDWRKDEFKNKGFNDKKQWGFVAQEVEEVMPELVGTDEDDYLTLNYNGFVPLLTKAMQEQQTEIENQQKEIDELKAQLEMIMKMMQSDMSDKTDNKKAENNQKPVKLSMATVK